MLEGEGHRLIGHNNQATSRGAPTTCPANAVDPPPDDDDELQLAIAREEELTEAMLARDELTMQQYDRWSRQEELAGLRRHMTARSKHVRARPSRRRHLARMRKQTLDECGIEWRHVSRNARDKRTPRQLAT